MIGCDRLHARSLPEIACHLSKDVKAHKFALDTNGWEHLRAEWLVEVEKKGNACVVDIILPPDVSSSFSLFNATNILAVPQRIGYSQKTQEKKVLCAWQEQQQDRWQSHHEEDRL